MTERKLSLPAEGFAKLPAVLHAAGVGRTTWLAMVRDGKAPAPLRWGPRLTVWEVSKVRAWIAERAAAGQPAQPGA